MTNCSRADAGAESNYPFLTLKERDNETGLDYFLARYYSNVQGRFTSPDEFTGGPDELYYFAEAASANPTFYADLSNPQSVNKYQYTYNNPLRYTDPDGHCPDGQPCPTLIVPTANISIAVAKEVANIGFGMNNFTHAFTGWGKHIEPYTADNRTQAITMSVTGNVAFFGGLATGKPKIGGVAIAEGEATAVAASAAANIAQQLPKASRPGAAGALQTADGQMFTATSGGKGGHHPVVQGVLDSVPKGQQSKSHGKCCEPRLITDALNSGANPRGAQISVVNVRRPGHAQHGTPKKACSSCQAVLDFMGIR